VRVDGCETELFGRFLGLRRFSAEADAGNLDARQLSAMADGPVITFTTTILERDDFFVLPLFDDFASDGGAFDQRVPKRKRLAIAMKKHIGKHAFFSRFLVEEVHINDVALRDAMLSTACFDNCVSHGRGKVAQGHMSGGS